MSCSSASACLPSFTPTRSHRRQPSFTPVVSEIEEEEAAAESDDDQASQEVCFLPDLEALRFWSHPRSSVHENPTDSLRNMDRQQGVLWKRRDVFKNRWRPRWFVLSPGQGVLTYYLLTSPLSEGVTSPFPQLSSNGTPMSEPARGTVAPLRARTTSWDSLVSENTVHYDVVPRGTIYLLGCSVKANHALSKPSEDLYSLTIRPPDSTESEIHLGARTAEARAVWIEKIARVCGQAAILASGGPVRSTLPLIIETPVAAVNQVTAESEVENHVSAVAQVEATFVNQVVAEIEDPLDSAVPQQTKTAVEAPTVIPTSWKSLGDASSVYANLAAPLVVRVQQGLKTNLALCDERPSPDWKRLFDDGVGRSAFQSVDDQGQMTTQSHCLLHNHTPKQVFNLLIDITRRQDFETNVRYDERLKVVSPHTFLDYYAFNAVWPTVSRDFTVLTHWQVVGRGDERAICLYSFSCPEANQIKPPLVDHVRANLAVSMYLLRAVGNDACRITRILSFDPAGNITRHLAHIAVSQQANLPATVGHYLDRKEPVPENRLKGPFTNEILIKNVIKRLPHETVGAVKRQLTYDNMDTLIVEDDENEKPELQVHEPPTLNVQALYLLAPVIVFQVATYLGIPRAGLSFCVSVFLVLREVVLLHYGAIVPKSTELEVVGPVTCRFVVDLKGVLRFIANKKEEREELNGGTAEVSVVHIAACAVARALKTESTLRQRRVRFPWLCIDECVEPSSDSVDVSISENSGGLITLKDVDSRGAQSIADALADAQQVTEATRELGQCMVLATPDYEHSDMELDVAPIHPDVAVVVVVGGVRLVRNTRNSRSSGVGSPAGIPRPMLSVSVTVNAAQRNDIVVSRRFSEEVQKLLQYPELCEN